MARRIVSRSLAVLLAGVAILATSCAPKQSSDTTSTSSPQASTESWTGDFDGMLQRGHIRMLVPYSRTLFYVENGQEHGLSADLAKDFETYLNQKYASQLGGKKMVVDLIPTTRDKLLSDLSAGLGDVSGGNLTATPSRMQVADFVAPTERSASELLVSGPGAPAVKTADDLSGKSVNVRQASSYFESLSSLNEKLGAANKPAVKIVTMPDALEDEDLLEMLNAGLFDFTVVDSWKAKLWAPNVPKVKVHDDVALRSGGTIAWAIRKQSPKLQEEIESFYKTASQQGLIAARLSNFQDRLKEISSSSAAALKHFDETLTLFRKYGKQDAFDPLMLAAEGFKEGAAGPAAPGTPPPSGAELEKNVQAAKKYIDDMMAKSFADAKFSDEDRTLFTFASYKAGADQIASMRAEAAKRGLDANQWFNNVELVTAEKLGMETTAYVRSILKYEEAYKLIAGGGATPKM